MTRTNRHSPLLVAALILPVTASLHADLGPFSGPVGDPGNPNAYDEPIPGYLDANGDPSTNIPGSVLNPIFVGWATGWEDYLPAPGVSGDWQHPGQATGASSNSHFDIVSLGDLNETQIDEGVPPGRVTLTFNTPITNGPGKDFAVFENGFISTGGAGVAGEILGELAYVEVSSDGGSFARFPCVSLTPGPVGAYGTVDATGIYNPAGKHVNSYPTGPSGGAWGTPFDLDDLLSDDLVIEGVVDLTQITHMRLVDIPGSGAFHDSATSLIDPATGLPWDTNHAVYDSWVTWGSGGFDLEAVGVLNRYDEGQVPEPGAILLFGVGLAVLARLRVPKDEQS